MLLKLSSIEFHENVFSGPRVNEYGQPDMTKLHLWTSFLQYSQKINQRVQNLKL
jgi:hypothetical protein